MENSRKKGGIVVAGEQLLKFPGQGELDKLKCSEVPNFLVGRDHHCYWPVPLATHIQRWFILWICGEDQRDRERNMVEGEEDDGLVREKREGK